MPIRQDDNQPNKRFGIVNIILIGVGAAFYLVACSLTKICKSQEFLTSIFIDQVTDGEVKRAISHRNKLDMS